MKARFDIREFEILYFGGPVMPEDKQRQKEEAKARGETSTPSPPMLQVVYWDDDKSGDKKNTSSDTHDDKKSAIVFSMQSSFPRAPDAIVFSMRFRALALWILISFLVTNVIGFFLTMYATDYDPATDKVYLYFTVFNPCKCWQCGCCLCVLVNG